MSALACIREADDACESLTSEVLSAKCIVHAPCKLVSCFLSPFNCFAWRVHAAGLIDYLQPPAAAKAFTGIILRVFVSYRSPTHKAGRHENTAPRGSWMRKEVLGGSLILPGCWMLLGSGDLRVVVVSCKWLFHLTSTSIFVTFLFYMVFYIE